MRTITLEIPKEVLSGRLPRRLVAVDPKWFARELRRQWEWEDAKEASKQARKEARSGSAREIRNLRELMR